MKASPVGSGEEPQPKTNLVYLALKSDIWWQRFLLDRDWGGVEADPPDQNFQSSVGGRLPPVGVKPPNPSPRQIEHW